MNYTETIKRKVIIRASAILIIIASLVGVFYNKLEKVYFEKDLITLKADSLLAVKNELQNELAALTNRINVEKLTIQELEANLDSKIITIKSREVALQEALDKLAMLENVENIKNIKNKDIEHLKTQINELQSMKTTLEKSFVELKGSNLTLINNTKDLQVKILMLESQLREAKNEITKIKYLASGDNFRIDVLKSNTAITTKAKKARTLRISMNIPSFLKTETIVSKPVYLSIFDEKESTIAGWNELVIVKDEHNKGIKMEVHNSKIVDFNKNPQNVSFDFIVQDKLVPGLYSAKLYTTDSYLGTVEFRVRDSFWFF
ncbi:coiled-coil domain-containing protein [Emticicia sp. SJ17W-69]|uniref:coiled-coil domain-containing protein n=1 Tax=Emticicia sp. SJ17W-69 TaxID=3421657 RepID=UPI003EC0A54B